MVGYDFYFNAIRHRRLVAIGSFEMSIKQSTVLHIMVAAGILEKIPN